MKKTFSDILDGLNAEQRKAVETIYGPVLVIAGPGSGKTQLLAVRIANILRETDANPSNILCLTFTDNAAKNMRERLVSIIGQDAYKVAIHTFHTFGLEILNRFRYKLTEDEELTPIDEIESSRIWDTLRTPLAWDHPWKKTSRLSLMRDTIRVLKDSGISPEEFKNILDINEQILNQIGPKIEEFSRKIYSLGQKKDDKIEKIRLFRMMIEEISPILRSAISHIGLQETLAPVIQRSFDEVNDSIESESDAKPITAWKNTWLSPKKDTWTLKDYDKQIDSLSLAQLYLSYTEALREKSLIDFSDMILRAIRLVETDEVVRATLAEQYQWMMVDEYQDTNDAQLRLITSILSQSIENPNIFAVGDDDQSIYKFQGASTRNIRLFRELYSDAVLIMLRANYRSHEEIIEFSRGLMVESAHSIGDIFPGEVKHFDSIRGAGGGVSLCEFETEVDELVYVANAVESLVSSGIKKSEIAIITKKNATLELLAKLLLNKHIPVTLSKDENIFADEVVSLIVNILKYISSLTDGTDRDELLITILSHPMWQISRITLWRLSREIASSRKKEKKVWIEALRTHSDNYISKIAHFMIELSIESKSKRLEDIIDIITGVTHLQISEDYTDETRDTNQFALTIDEEEQLFISPLYTYYFSQERLKEKPILYTQHLTNIRKLIESIRSYRYGQGRLLLQDFSTYIDLIREYDISLTASHLVGDTDAVQCITAHKAKGLEYEHVFSIGLTEKQYKRGKNSGNPLPSNLSLAPERDDDEDIRRLIYTVATRAKDHLTCTYARMGLSEKTDSLVSTLGGIDSDKWTIIKSEMNENERSILLEQEYHELAGLPYTGEEGEYLKGQIGMNFSLSATALQNFLDITSGGPVHFISNNILRFPQAKSESASYGTAMHKALEDFFSDYKIHGTYKKSILTESFEKKLREDGFEESKEKEFLERGYANLEKLYDKITGTTYGELHLEHRFNDVYLGDMKLTGAIDRIEVTPEAKLIITDYKTGSGFDTLVGGSGYEALKKWKYHLQLCFYAVLFSLSPRWAVYKQHEYRLFFIEEDRETGEFYEVVEYIHEGEIERTKMLIRAVMEKIRTLDFPDISQYPDTVEGIRMFEEDLLSGQV